MISDTKNLSIVDACDFYQIARGTFSKDVINEIKTNVIGFNYQYGLARYTSHFLALIIENITLVLMVYPYYVR